LCRKIEKALLIVNAESSDRREAKDQVTGTTHSYFRFYDLAQADAGVYSDPISREDLH
jgi:hypothetical protein